MKKLRAAVAALVLMGATQASAATITIGSCYTGDCANLSGSVLVEISDDTLAQNTGDFDVKVVITNNTNGYIDELGLFYTGGFPGDAAIEGFTVPVGTVNTVPTLVFGATQNDNSGQGLNIGFDYASNNQQQGANRFDAGEQVAFFLDSPTAQLFAATFATGKGFVHIQAIAPGGNSAKLTTCQPSVAATAGCTTTNVPEPSSLLLLCSGLAVAASRALRRR